MSPGEFQELHGLMSKLEVVQGRMDERLERIEGEIRGNGQPGMVQRIQLLENSQAVYVGTVKARDRFYGMVATGIAGVGVLLEWIFHGHK